MTDPFVGTWTLNLERSEFDPNHRPSQGTMTWRSGDGGEYLLLAEGVDEKGRPCAEKPQRLLPDGNAYPIENLPGLTSVTTRPSAHVIRAEARREDASLVGEGTYEVAADGKTMTATTKGFDSQLRPFTMRTVWDRG
jgi:hypothetical protein